MAKATLTHGREGGRAVAWIAGIPQGFSRQYEFPAGKPYNIADVDADAIQAGLIDLGGRVIEVEVKAKPAADKAPAGDGATAAAKPALPVTGKD